MKITVTKLLSWCPENAVADQGKGRGGPGHTFDFRPNWGPKEIFSGTAHPLSLGLDDQGPPYLKVWIRHWNVQ